MVDNANNDTISSGTMRRVLGDRIQAQQDGTKWVNWIHLKEALQRYDAGMDDLKWGAVRDIVDGEG